MPLPFWLRTLTWAIFFKEEILSNSRLLCEMEHKSNLDLDERIRDWYNLRIQGQCRGDFFPEKARISISDNTRTHFLSVS